MQTRILKVTTIHIIKNGLQKSEKTLYYSQKKPWWSPFWITIDWHYELWLAKRDIIKLLGNKSIIKEIIKFPDYESNNV